MDEININEEILARINENRLEALLQERIIQSFTNKNMRYIQSVINRQVFEFAEKRGKACMTFV